MNGILSFTTVFPSPAAPHSGSFVRSRLERVGQIEKVRVLAPVAHWDYRRRTSTATPAWRREGSLEIYHPRWIPLPGGGALNGFLLFLQALPCALRIGRKNFDVIDAHFGHPEAFAAALLAMACRRPFVVTLRGSEAVHSRYPLRRFFMGWALRRAARVIAVSERLRQLALDLGVDPLRAVKVPNGVDRAVFHPRDREAARARLGIPSGTKAILTAGNLIWEKGQHRAIEALANLRQQGLAAELFIAGAPGREGGSRYAAGLRTLAAERGVAERVHFLGVVKAAQLAEYMCACDVFCLASQREGWPNVVHESLACGTPVVATDVGAVPELIPSSAYGAVVPRGDQAALEEALAGALAAQWDAAAVAARAGARTWDRVAREVIVELENAAAGRLIPGGARSVA